ncbi:hypothetical protein Tco_0103719 [Tanacetum coccineum]|uniref:Reverse transcriptase domain-containing protein n=1 Tax=Tanacetum coccineum TaxID=301880 RepID=A0ABQ4Y2J8_9ASTR
MLAIFHDMIEESVEVFMDDFSVFGSSFDHYLNNLDKMLQRCKDAHLVLNWEKCHFMVKEEIILGHKGFPKAASTFDEMPKIEVLRIENEAKMEFSSSIRSSLLIIGDQDEDAELYYNTTTNMSNHYSETTFASKERVEVLDSDESDDDEPAEMIEDHKLIHYLSGSPTPFSDPETDTLLPHHDSTSPEVDDDNFDREEIFFF